jgi:hypothetical protein
MSELNVVLICCHGKITYAWGLSVAMFDGKSVVFFFLFEHISRSVRDVFAACPKPFQAVPFCSRVVLLLWLLWDIFKYFAPFVLSTSAR